MNLAKLVSIGIALLLIQACSHPIEIEGEGNVMSASGTRTCLLENFQAGDDVCSKNYVIGAYQETYMPTAEPGWQFDHWVTYCTTATAPNYECSFSATAAQVQAFWGKTVPPLKAVFVTQCGDGIKAGIEQCDDGNKINGDGCEATCTLTPDADEDGVPDVTDNCPTVSNQDQSNFDSDTFGDACDDDDDNDGIPDVSDYCPLDTTPSCGTGIPIPVADTITKNGTVWAQPDLFGSSTWYNINNVCPGGICKAKHVYRGYDMTGWKWASASEVAVLFNSYGVSSPLSTTVFPDERTPIYTTAWVNNPFNAGWRPTYWQPGLFRGFGGFTSDDIPTISDRRASFWFDELCPNPDYYGCGPTDKIENGTLVDRWWSYPSTGAFFYK